MPIIVAILAFIRMAVFNDFHAHEHCIKQTGLAFRMYADDHDGNLPTDTNGFWQRSAHSWSRAATLETNGTYSIGLITGPGDDGAVFRVALKTGAPIPEEKCSRVYIQGLSEKNNPQIAILFDKKVLSRRRSCSAGRGDRYFVKSCLLDGSMQIIGEKSWPVFSSNQVELLVQAGIARATAEHCYKIP